MPERARAVGERRSPAPGPDRRVRLADRWRRRRGGWSSGCSWVGLAAGVEVVEVAREVGAPVLGLGDHRLEPLDLAAQRRRPGGRRGRGRPRGSRAARRRRASARNVARLRARAASSSSSWPISASEKPGVVAQAADEPQALEVLGVVQAVGALRAGGGGEEAELLVVADRARRQAGVGRDLLDPQQARSARRRRRGWGRGVVTVDPTKPCRSRKG